MLHFLHDLLVLPLMQLYATLFDVPSWLSLGGRILVFSVVINLIVAPLYSQMELRSRAGREKRAAVEQDVQRMRRHFRGRERYFYVRAVYRQHAYRPWSQLWASGDLLLQILVFASVFHFLHGALEVLPGASFGPLRDLSKPDALLGGFNLLPLLMTVINVASLMSYVENRGRRLQAAALALLFLVLLYPSPSGLVLYWTMNNVFSLIRNLLRRHSQSQPPRPYSLRLAELRQQQ
jgi:membrane protein insertase Oxa1/YidC/SpoIIIJ